MEKIIYEIGNGETITFRKPTQSLKIANVPKNENPKEEENVIENNIKKS